MSEGGLGGPVFSRNRWKYAAKSKENKKGLAVFHLYITPDCVDQFQWIKGVIEAQKMF